MQKTFVAFWKIKNAIYMEGSPPTARVFLSRCLKQATRKKTTVWIWRNAAVAEMLFYSYNMEYSILFYCYMLLVFSCVRGVNKSVCLHETRLIT